MNNLNNISDDELDKVFREASEDGFADDINNEWPLMKERLERETPQPSLWAKYRGFIIVLLLLIPVTLIYVGSKPSSSKILSEKNTKEINEKPTENKETGKNITKKPNGITLNKNESYKKSIIEKNNKIVKDFSENKILKSAQSKTKESQNSIRKMPSFAQKLVETCSGTFKSKEFNPTAETKKTKIKSASKEPLARAITPVENRKSIESTNAKVNKTNPNNLIDENTIFTTVSKPLSEIPDTGNPNELNMGSENVVSESNLTEPEKIPLNLNATFLTSFLGPLIISNNVNQDSVLNPKIVLEKPAEKPTTEDYFKKGFYGQIGYSPDISLVSEFDKEVSIGRNQAFLLNYRFSKKWSIQSGIIKAVKNYSAYPADYKWVWKNVNTPLKEIMAVCRMIDIPVNVRYDFKSSPRGKFFGSTGLTSYLMQKETYNYFYENDADPSIKWRQWNGKTGFYAAGVLNFSTGLEYKLTKKLSFQIEPFAKIPIKQIGFGKVKLSTYGVLVSANYPLNFSSKK
jgi:hypothetical protein